MGIVSRFRYKPIHMRRYVCIVLFFFVCGCVLAARLVFLQLIRGDFYRNLAENHRTAVISLPPVRGILYDAGTEALAVNVPKISLYAVPRYIRDKPACALQLAGILECDEESIMDRISNDRLFAWIRRKVPDDVAKAVRRLDLEGIGMVTETERRYPGGALACHVLGFVDIDNNGLEGLEFTYNDILKGEAGYKIAVCDARRRQVDTVDAHYLPARNGYHIRLSLDSGIQHIAEKALQEGVARFNPVAASAVVLKPDTGQVLALCNWPAYDLNEFTASTTESRRNRALTDMIEPGSAFKVVTAGAALEEGIVSLGDRIDCEHGEYRIAGRTLHDHRPHGTLTASRVFEVSSNIGTVKIAERLDESVLYDYIRQFGFAEKTGIDLCGEIPGFLRDTQNWSKGSIAALPIGQEIGCTVLQLCTAAATIANDGIAMRPYLAVSVERDNGTRIKSITPRIRRRVVSRETAVQLQHIMCRVIEDGTGKRAALTNYRAGGKTGTAQRLEDNGAYSHSKFNAVFIGFAPYPHPHIAVAVVFVEPRPFYYGGTVAAPVFAEIAENTLRYLQVPFESEGE